MGYRSHVEAMKRGIELVPVGSQWLKIVSGRRFVVSLVEEGKLVEWVEGHEHDTWPGFWTTGARYEYPDFVVKMQIRVGDYEARISFVDEDKPRGYEFSEEINATLNSLDRRLVAEGSYNEAFPGVELYRLS